MSKEQIIRALGVTAEAMGHQLSPAGLLLMAEDLEPYGVEAVLAALTRVRRDCRKLTVADVIDRISMADGRPKPDEAWASALCALDESDTVVWTEETQQAFAVARPLLEINDKTGARMAFRDAYERLVDLARQKGLPAKWGVSLGWDKDRRATVLAIAVNTGKLPGDYARGLLPPAASRDAGLAVLSLVASNGVLTDKASSAIDRENARRRIAEIKSILVDHEKGAA